jgi:hypothetical protein
MKLKEKLAINYSTIPENPLLELLNPGGKHFVDTRLKDAYIAGFQKAKDLIRDEIDECFSNDPEARPKITYSISTYEILLSVSEVVCELGNEEEIEND